MFHSVLQVFRLLRLRDRGIFASLVVLRMLVQALDVLGLAIVGALAAVASSASGPGRNFLLDFGVDFSTPSDYLVAIVAIVGLFTTKSLLSLSLVRATTTFLARVEAEASAELVENIYMAEFIPLKSFSRGEIQWLAITSTQLAFFGVLFASATALAELFLFVAIFSTFLVVDALMGLILALYLGAAIGVFQLIISKRLTVIGNKNVEFQQKVSDSILSLNDTLPEASVLERRDRFVEIFAGNRRSLANNKANEKFALSLPRHFLEIFLFLGVLVLSLYITSRGFGIDAFSSLGIFLIGGMRLMASLLPLQNAINDLRLSLPQADRAVSMISAARSEAQESTSQDLLCSPEKPKSANGTRVSVKNLGFTYPGSDAESLRGISLNVEPGEFCAVIGPSGSGKSTLIELILGLREPHRGSVFLDGMSPAQFRKSRKGEIGYVPQRPAMVSGSVAENIALGIDVAQIDEARVWEVLELAHLSHFVADLPKGIYENLGNQADSLSGGELQRIGLARALYPEPKLLVLDEATSSLDADTEARISNTLSGRRGNSTLIVVAHRLTTIQKADTVYVVDSGEIVASGSLPTLRQTNPMVERYIRLMNVND